jgi:hypothetical protein
VARRTAKRTAKQRAQLRRAQLISARKRRGKGKKTKLAIGVVAIGSAGLGAYATRNAVRESKLKKKHGADYIPRKFTGYHYTSNNSARRIVKTRNWKSTKQNGPHGLDDASWFTRRSNDKVQRGQTGNARIKVRGIKRKDVIYTIPHGNAEKNNPHFQVKNSALRGKRASHNLPKTSRGIRSRGAAGFKQYYTALSKYEKRYVANSASFITNAQPKYRRKRKKRK